MNIYVKSALKVALMWLALFTGLTCFVGIAGGLVILADKHPAIAVTLLFLGVFALFSQPIYLDVLEKERCKRDGRL